MFKKISVFFIFLFMGLIFADIVKAVCPLCVVAVGGGLGFSRWLGVDDLISSIWIGALLVALSIWTITWLEKKNRKFKYQKIIITAVYYLLTLFPLYYYSVIGHPLNKIFGIDKIILGVIIGTAVFLVSTSFHNFLKKKNQGKQFFNYQKVILPFIILLITSFIIYFLLKWI
jgi:hypothetical protein